MVTLRCLVGLSQNLWVWKKASCNFSVCSAFSRILFLPHQGSFLAMLKKHFEWFVPIQSHVAGRRKDSLFLKTTATKIFKFLLQEMFLPRISELLGWKKCGENARNIFSRKLSWPSRQNTDDAGECRISELAKESHNKNNPIVKGF